MFEVKTTKPALFHIQDGKPAVMRFERATFYVLPSASLRDLCRRHAQRLLPGCNYIMQWRDVNGYGIELCIADWVPENHVYFIP